MSQARGNQTAGRSTATIAPMQSHLIYRLWLLQLAARERAQRGALLRSRQKQTDFQLKLMNSTGFCSL
jgi:hypothetical protein